MIVIPAPYQVRGELQPRFGRGNLRHSRKHWTPVFTGETTFYETDILSIANFSLP